MLIATFDIGTTAVKGVLVSEQGACICAGERSIQTIYTDNWKEQNPLDWYQAFCSISADFLKNVSSDQIQAIIMSGQMQDMIPVDSNCMPVQNAVLYSDGRAEREAEEICRELKCEDREHYAEAVTGNHYDGSLSFPKIVWLKNNKPELFKRVHKVLISSKDYVIARLTGIYCSDVVACATAGAMDIEQKKWDETILRAGHISPEQMPQILHAHEVAGSVSEKAAKETGYAAGTKVYAGTGDAGATTLASGITMPGEYNINLGTSGWVAAISDHIFESEGGVFNLAAMTKEKYINVVPFLNAGNVHKWIGSLFSEDSGSIDYEKINQILQRSTCGSHGVLFLPYLVGERFPVMDEKIKGCYYGITAETTQCDLVRSALEGVAFSIRQGIESIGIPAKRISVIGGGARVDVWCQILADVLDAPLYVYHNSDILPSLAIASAVLLEQGIIKHYSDFVDSLQTEDKCTVFYANSDRHKEYEKMYPEYRKLYPALRKMEIVK